MAIVQDPETGEWYDNGGPTEVSDIQTAYEGGQLTFDDAMSQMRQINIANSYDPDIGGSTWDAYLSDIAGAGSIDPGQTVSLAGQYAKDSMQDPSNIVGKLLKGMGIDLSGGIAAAINSPSNAALGLGSTGLLATLAALTSKPSTTAGNTTQTSTTGQTTAGTTGQTTAGTSGQTQKVGFDQWYEDMVKASAEGIPTKGYESFDKDMLNLPNNRAIADYMSPYMEQVANPIMRRQAEDQAAQSQKFAAERVSRGAFGSGRADILSNQMQERQALERDNTLSGIYNQAFGSATGLAQNDLNRSFDDWKLLQAGGIGTVGQATAQGNLLKGLAPGATTTVAGNTAGTTTGTTAGTTTGTTGQTGSTSYTGADPSRLGQLAGISGTIWGMANPNGLPK